MYAIRSYYEIIDSKTSYGLNRVYDYSMGAGTSTKIYTYFRPWRKLFGDKVNAIRHVATPSVGFNYSPDFSQNKFGFYDEIEYYDDRITSYNVCYTKLLRRKWLPPIE